MTSCRTLQACGQWDLDTPPNGGIDTVELDADEGDARAAEDRLLMGRPVGLGLAYAPPIEVHAPSL
jgi:hypothetical protein